MAVVISSAVLFFLLGLLATGLVWGGVSIPLLSPYRFMRFISF
jgi:hypothetical protein